MNDFSSQASAAPHTPTPPLSPGQRAALAILLEVTAPKVGNVHRGADFEDVGYLQFVAGAVAIVPAMDAAARLGAADGVHGQSVHRQSVLGHSVLAAVRATAALVGTNTNLGTILLLTPLAMTRADEPFDLGVKRVLAGLTADDARDVYAAIVAARPGGMAPVEKHDLAGPPPADLIEAMGLAAERDRVARQFVTGFADVLEFVVPSLADSLGRGVGLDDAIVHTQLATMAKWPDSLIARKCGLEMARRVSDQAAAVLSSGPPESELFQGALADLDFFLRSDGHRRNPGTTADLIAAGLYVALREGIIEAPLTRFFPSMRAP